MVNEETPSGRYLDPPIALLDGELRGEWSFHILEWEEGVVFVQAKSAPVARPARALRIHVREEEKDDPPAWWDITSRQLQAHLRTVLPHIKVKGMQVRIRQWGLPPRVFYSVDVIP